MSVFSRIVERSLGLPPAVTRKVAVTRGLRVPMRDGTVLLADLCAPRNVRGAPTVLIRTPYGRTGMLSAVTGRPFAERGYQVLTQSVRGTAGSEGEFDPFGREREDGLDTLDWIEKQPWFNGTVLTFGPSYLGYAQWAVAPDAGDRIAAMAASVSASQFRDQTYMGGTYTLRGTLAWTAMMVGQRDHLQRAQLRDLAGDPRVRAAMDTLPLADADLRATGRHAEWFQRWLRTGEPGDPYWVPERDHRARVGEVTAPVSMVGGWYDLFLDAQLADYIALRAAGRRAQLTVGPWVHGDRAGFATSMREALNWFEARVTGRDEGLRELPVRLYVQGAGEWRDYLDWPPPAVPRSWHLLPGGGLGSEAPPESAPDRFRYDPADPTPGVGGPLMGRGGGQVDNAEVEARPDVLVYTCEVLTRPVEIIGPVSATVHLRSSLGYTDVFVRVCDVDPRGRSRNVCDGVQRVTPGAFPADGDGVLAVGLRLWPTAYRFAAGHRIRVQVSSGSYPRFARNLGTGEPLATATRMVAADQEVFHDPAHPSAVVLPVSEG